MFELWYIFVRCTPLSWPLYFLWVVTCRQPFLDLERTETKGVGEGRRYMAVANPSSIWRGLKLRTTAWTLEVEPGRQPFLDLERTETKSQGAL